jgi:hypothetical protein
MPVHKAAAIRTVVFLIGVDGWRTLAPADARRPDPRVDDWSTEPTAANSAPASEAAVPSGTYTATTPPRTTQPSEQIGDPSDRHGAGLNAWRNPVNVS